MKYYTIFFNIAEYAENWRPLYVVTRIFAISLAGFHGPFLAIE